MQPLKTGMEESRQAEVKLSSLPPAVRVGKMEPPTRDFRVHAISDLPFRIPKWVPKPFVNKSSRVLLAQVL